jgi:hypothetical protein
MYETEVTLGFWEWLEKVSLTSSVSFTAHVSLSQGAWRRHWRGSRNATATSMGVMHGCHTSSSLRRSLLLGSPSMIAVSGSTVTGLCLS